MENALARFEPRRFRRTGPQAVWVAAQDARELGGKRSRIESRFSDNKSGSRNKQRLPWLQARRAFSFPDERCRAALFHLISLNGDILFVGDWDDQGGRFPPLRRHPLPRLQRERELGGVRDGSVVVPSVPRKTSSSWGSGKGKQRAEVREAWIIGSEGHGEAGRGQR
jgi:hypothetical protein